MNEEVKSPELVEVVVTAPVRRKSGPKPKSASPLPAVVQELEPIKAVVALPDPKAELRAKIARQRAEMSVPVTGKFLFNECPGGRLQFVFREFPGDQLVKYDMYHDQIYTVPLGVAVHLNDRCSYPEYQHNMDNGKAINAENMYIKTAIHRTNFIPLNFTLNSGYKPHGDIAQVTYTNPMLG